MAALEASGRPAGELMQRAAAALATAVLDELGGGYGRSVLVLANSGGNGGDALHAGARLLRRGVAVRACATSSQGLHRGGAHALLAAGGRTVELGEAEALLQAGRVDLVLDGALGIGGRGGLTGTASRLAEVCARTGARVLAVDLPSGLVADSGAVHESFTATRTVTFGTRRLVHLQQPAASRCGRVEVADIGLRLPEPDLRGWEVADLAAALPVPGPTDHKYSRGVVGLDTGSAQYPGAALLGVLGAVHTGVGMVRYLGSAAETVTARLPNVVTAAGRVQALVLGSGWGADEDGPRRLREAFARTHDEGSALLLDADALAALPALVEDPTPRPAPDRLLLTPHAGELARLLDRDRDDVETDPLGAAREAATRYGATVLLKGASQYVVRPGVDVVDVALPGPAWTGQAGSGDVLAGICGSLLAGGLPAGDAAAAGASLQALAAARHPGPQPPQTLAERLPELVAGLTSAPGATRRRAGTAEVGAQWGP
nr:bifunctional ADP-dependent NAD(P)H-hydrate dehydratase/NAD(P)H-hydrate epimerase [Auraticoccus cholistanensis]